MAALPPFVEAARASLPSRESSVAFMSRNLAPFFVKVFVSFYPRDRN
jgi:hypothetical protein